MTIEKTILKIRTELIRAVSGLDAWFDKEDALFDHRPSSGEKSVREILESVMVANHSLLEMIDTSRASHQKNSLAGQLDDYCLMSQELNDVIADKSFTWDTNEAAKFEHKELSDIRHEIREQLDRCLIHLELLMQGEGIIYKTNLCVDRLGTLDVYQSLYFLALHVRRHLGQLDQVLEDYKLNA